MTATAVPVNNQQELYEWLRVQAEKLGLRVSLLTEKATLVSGWLYLPARIEDVTDAYDNALKLQQLEDTWNDRDPQPDLPLFLIPAKDPLRQASYERVIQAMRRKIKAVESFSNATNREEQERAAAEFQSAERAEDEVGQAYERVMPLNQRVPQ